MSTEATSRLFFWTGAIVWLGPLFGSAFSPVFPNAHFHLQAGSTEQMIAWHELQAKKLKEQAK